MLSITIEHCWWSHPHADALVLAEYSQLPSEDTTTHPHRLLDWTVRLWSPLPDTEE